MICNEICYLSSYDWTNYERTQILAYTRFIRAYAYYNLLMNWGPVVLLYDEIPNNNEEMIYYDRPRDLYDECVEYICTEFEEAAPFLYAFPGCKKSYNQSPQTVQIMIIRVICVLNLFG